MRDLAEWIVHASEERLTGAFNATSEPHALADVLAAAGADGNITWVDEDFLLEREVGQWMELPLWISAEEGAAFHRVDTTKAHGAGLRHRALEETAKAALAEAETVDGVGLSSEREAELLREWHAR